MRCKLITSTAISVLITLCVLFGNKIVAYASDYVFDVRVETITSSEAVAYNQAVISSGQTNAMTIQADDYKVSIVLANNLGYNVSGMSIDYGISYFDLLTKTNGTGVVYLEGDATPNVMSVSKTIVVIDGMNVGRVGIATMGGEIEYDDGIIVSVFFRKKTGTSSSDIDKLIRSLNVVELEYSETGNTYEITNYTNNSSGDSQTNGFYLRSQTYLCGDIDEDGDVDAMDAQILTALLNAQTGTNHTISVVDLDGTYSYTDGSGTHTFDKLMIVTAANVDQNGIIDYDDAYDILEYFADHIVNGLPYVGVIGTYVTGYQFITYGSVP